MSARSGQLRDRRRGRQKRHVSPARLILSITVIVVFAAGTGAGDTRTGARIAAAAQRFLTFYSGVFALVALTTAVAAGLLATDRIFMSVGNRIVAQAVHRAVSFVSVAFLITHIAMEVVVGKSTAIDSVMPFLARGRTFYVGIGTIASDLIVLLVATGIARRSFAERSSPFVWRILHGSAYLAWPLSIVHGLAAGRPAKPYVSWSYGACLIAVGVALVLRSVATVRPRRAPVQAWPDDAGSPTAAASVAAQAYLLHTQRAAAAAGLSARQPPGLAAGPGGQVMQWQEREPSQWPATPAVGIPVLPAAQYQTPTAGMPVAPAAEYGSPPAGVWPASTSPGTQYYSAAGQIPPAPGTRYHSPPPGAPVDPWAYYRDPAGGMPASPRAQPPQEYEAVPYQVQALYPPPDEQAGWAGR